MCRLTLLWVSQIVSTPVIPIHGSIGTFAGEFWKICIFWSFASGPLEWGFPGMKPRNLHFKTWGSSLVRKLLASPMGAFLSLIRGHQWCTQVISLRASRFITWNWLMKVARMLVVCSHLLFYFAFFDNIWALWWLLIFFWSACRREQVLPEVSRPF